MARTNKELEQGSKEWHKWRNMGLGASDAPAVMSVSPWTSRFELWSIKTGLLTPPEPHINSAIAMRRGQECEPKARELYIKQTGIQVEPITVEHKDYPFIRASLDGYNAETRHVLEIKTPGKTDWETAKKGKIPTKYKWQLAQQCMIVDALSCDYVTYDGKEQIIIVPYERNRDDEARLLSELISFWELVETRKAPSLELSDLDKIVQRLLKEADKLSQSAKALSLVTELLLESSLGD